MKVYVGGAYCDKPAVQQVQRELCTAGYTVTHDWTTAANETALESALCDQRGVKFADIGVLVFSVSDHAYRGTFTEMGMALGLEKPIYALCLVDGAYKCNPFLQLPQVQVVDSLHALVGAVTDIPYKERLRMYLRRPMSPYPFDPIGRLESESDQDDSSESDGDGEEQCTCK